MPAASGNTAPTLTSITIFFFCWAVFTYVLRLWVKLPKLNFWGIDDTVVSFALLAALANLISTCYAVNHGFGALWSSIHDLSAVQKALFAAQIFYIVSMGLTRISNSLFTARFVTRAKHHIRIAHAFSGIYIVWTVGSVFAIALRAPFLHPWQKTDGSADLFVRWTVVEAIGCLLDLTTVVFATYLVWALQMPLKKRLSVAAIFATRLLIWPIIALRLWKLSPSQRVASSPSIAAEVLTQVVMDTALNLASVTCLKPFLKPFQDSGYILSSTQDAAPKYGITGASRSRSESYLMLGTAGSTIRNKNGSIVRSTTEKEPASVTQYQSTPRARLRGDAWDHEAACEHEEREYSGTPQVIRVLRTVQVQRDDEF